MTSETEETEIVSTEKHKRHKKEKKNIDKALLEQIEFYFSDANLSKDKFLSELVNESEDNFVDISVFLKFNKVRALTTNVEDIANALAKSSFLQVSPDRKLVRRTTPVAVNEDVDKCTIYVENLPQNVDHDWLRERFNGFGKITYVSLPKFRISKKVKGFAFVEFGSVEAAESACKSFSKTEDKVPDQDLAVKKEVLEPQVPEEPPKKKVKLEEPETKSNVEPAEKKRRNRRKKQKVRKEEPNLKVISKLEWKRFRNKYLTLQKANMAELKKYLSLQQDEAEVQEPEPETKSQPPQFAPNLIIKLNYAHPVKDAKKIRGELKAVIGVRYVELEEDAVCGYIRCDCAEITDSVVQSVQSKASATVIAGEEEQMYWNKIKDDRDKKMSGGKHSKTKKRGFDKIIHRAIKINTEKTATHIRFDD